MVLMGNVSQIDRSTVGFELRLDDEVVAALTTSSNMPLRTNPTALIAAFLPIAAKMGHDLHIVGSLDSRAVAGSIPAIDILTGWYDDLLPARLLECAVSTGEHVTAKGVACLASLGLDSFYSIHTRRAEITHLVICRGFDISLDNDRLWEQTVGVCRTVAATEGKTLIEVTTDIRSLSDKYMHWATRFHGAAIAAVAHLLDEHIAHLIVPSSFTSDEGMSWGTHTRLDHLWSSSLLTFEHHPVGVSRVEKMRAVADNASAMQYMRVCTKNLSAYNCGRCEKCIRTACNAIAVGVGGRIASLPEVTAADVMAMPMKPARVQFLAENLTALRLLPSSQRRPDLEAALEARIKEFEGA